MGVRKYTELIAWQRAIDLVVVVYKFTDQFPRHELYGLAGQLRRGVVSVPSNIAEGQSRRSVREFLHYLEIAYGSINEVETQLIIAERLGYIRRDVLEETLEQTAEVGRLINGLANSIGRKPRTDN
jgi:four helix bundle protein